MANSTWAHLLGLPAGQAASLLNGTPVRIVPTCAPRRDHDRPAEDAPRTQRVIRVREMDGIVEMTVSDFPDGAPKQA